MPLVFLTIDKLYKYNITITLCVIQQCSNVSFVHWSLFPVGEVQRVMRWGEVSEKNKNNNNNILTVSVKMSDRLHRGNYTLCLMDLCTDLNPSSEDLGSQKQIELQFHSAFVIRKRHFTHISHAKVVLTSANLFSEYLEIHPLRTMNICTKCCTNS